MVRPHQPVAASEYLLPLLTSLPSSTLFYLRAPSNSLSIPCFQIAQAPVRKNKKKVDRTQLELDVGPGAGAKPGKGGKATIARVSDHGTVTATSGGAICNEW